MLCSKKTTTSMTSILNAHPSVRLQSADTGVVDPLPCTMTPLENPVTDAGKEVCETLGIAEGQDCQSALKDTKDMCSSAPDTPPNATW